MSVAQQLNYGLDDIQDAITNNEIELKPNFSNWVEKAIEAFDANGEPNYVDSKGELIEGIYINMPNDLYHSLPALSSSQLKEFKESPPHYFRRYLSGIEVKRTLQTQRTLDAGTLGHELILEPEDFHNKYFRELLPIDEPDALHTEAQIKAELEKLNLKTTGSKAVKTERLLNMNPNAKVFDDLQRINREKQGVQSTAVIEGEEKTLYGGKLGVDGQVWDSALRIVKSLKNEPQADAYINYGLPEVAIIARCPRTNLLLKVKFDWLRFDDEAADVKTTRSANPDDFSRQMRSLKYDLQQAFYTYVASLVGINIRRFLFVAIEYASADYCQLFKIKDTRLAKAFEDMHKAKEEFVECKRTGKWLSRYSGSVIELD
ncbi:MULTISPECIES: PD-(D/E)XK nuclease-like domain-containing protein [unclassified Pseudoalteromonas]|uniref:PD-(D/E)XK nuclease-like domain-containing protein n=1 Tax=unclassified Pseudoalteromonas TaxID=194690 RepID=UPI002359F73C|nr:MULTISPECIES: PD-(D/E)XK nuclease-like domain-containing protein [unclassified Pseudoalteromonas]MDC9563424.1 PD-(D/E)XK nuclease-like domain-containing protein [Pseudoalteromonas sp. GAB2316C]MDC9572094.1 PD-(D/E)XK nuclease-like domain-containing protein [Pseudoalteromonas sp. GABNS16A]MDC9583871.1 PD-(D/E)XK nuclease-like domain-containing protein [Pseudoalteromonas sp. GABNS16C]MDC9607860.1 PD-(D/E)XK nuclease-like domain-containing protein [Pseudoalteromonas sp. GABNS16H]